MSNEDLSRALHETEKKLADLELAKNSASKRITELRNEKRLHETEAERDARLTETNLDRVTDEVQAEL